MRSVAALAGLAAIAVLLPLSAARAEVQDCIPITALPAVIVQQGVHCLKQDLATSMTTGNAITINANNVILEMNGFKLGGLGAGAATQARGIYALNRQNITIRNGSVRSFWTNITLDNQSPGGSSGHIVEDMRVEAARYVGIWVIGSRVIVRNNFVFDTGNSSINAFAYGIAVQDGGGHVVTGNVVTDVTETGETWGIYSNSARAIVQSNKVTNTSNGVYGIYNIGIAACLDNVVSGFSTPLSGCSLNNGNRTF